MNLVLLCAAVLVSMIVLRIGAIAFQLTGLEWSLANFRRFPVSPRRALPRKKPNLLPETPNDGASHLC